MTNPLRIGFALTGSFCTFSRVLPVIQSLTGDGCVVTPVLSANAGSLDTRFGTAAGWRDRLSTLTGRAPIRPQPITRQRAPCRVKSVCSMASWMAPSQVGRLFAV